MTTKERDYVRDLAMQLHEKASHPAMDERRRKWNALNNGQTNEPLVVMKFHGVYADVYPLPRCEDPLARSIEQSLTYQLTEAAFEDDRVIEDIYVVYPDNWFRAYGLDTSVRTTAKDSQGKATMGYAAQHPIGDLEKDFHLFKKSNWHVDEQLANARKRQAQVHEVIGDILRVVIQFPSPGTSLVYPLCELMGMENMLYAVCDHPKRFLQAMEMQTNDLMEFLDEIEKKQALLCNGDSSRVSQDSYGYTDDLPKNGALHRPISCRDTWGYSNSQETVGMSPEMFGEFVFPFIRRYAQRFGLFAFGCCEPVDVIWENCLATLPNLRKLSISPWCNEFAFAEKIRGRKIVYHRKPSPNLFAMPSLDEEALAKQLKQTVLAASGCPLEITFRDITSVHGDPGRLKRGVKIAKEQIQRYWKP